MDFKIKTKPRFNNLKIRGHGPEPTYKMGQFIGHICGVIVGLD